MSVKCVCPECGMSITAAAGAASVTCPICDTPVSLPATLPRTAGKRPVPREGVAVSQRRLLVFGLLGTMAVLWLGGGIAAVLYFFYPNGDSTAAQARLDPTAPIVEIETCLVRPPPTSPSESPATSEQQKINAAIARGVVSLKRQLKTAPTPPPNSGSFGFTGDDFQRGYTLGATALIGLALLECDVPASDPAVVKAAQTIRAARFQLTYTYALATSILFLDRLGDKQDRDLIRSLALRLVAGQIGIGGWYYSCPYLGDVEEKQLLDFLATRTNGKGGPINPADFTINLRKCSLIRAADPADTPGREGDNSNTQFGVLALWVSRRHDLPVQPALVRAELHFRSQQAGDGGWDYASNLYRSSMTCAALLALAVGRSVDPKAADGKEPAKDATIERGFQFLAARIGPDSPRIPQVPPQNNALIQSDSWGDLYYLWSLERVAMVYDLKTIGGKDWYAWAAPLIVKAQKDDGSWKEFYSAPVDTCFALLVLKRSNVVPDLTTEVKKTINLKDISGPTEK